MLNLNPESAWKEISKLRESHCKEEVIAKSRTHAKTRRSSAKEVHRAGGFPLHPWHLRVGIQFVEEEVCLCVEMCKKAEDTTPLEWLGEVSNVAPLVAFLATDEELSMV
ncbi:hypothetical protein SUGI_0597600 [Cryptomeria japonica]|nr:hypothetical protein SUGI_0597600 [Cryptomeria japonica]